MNKKLKWGKNISSGTYSLFTEGTLCGYLKSNVFSDSSNAELKGQRYSFKTNGVFKRQTIIYELETFRNLGMNTYDELGSKSIILIEGNVMFFRYDSLWRNSWKISNTTGNQSMSTAKFRTRHSSLFPNFYSVSFLF